ncbi:MAG: twin-arginine translocase subunit TatC [Moorellales bacterium]
MSRKSEMTFLEHLEELRRVLVVCGLTLGITSGIVYGLFRQQLLAWVTAPLLKYQVPLIYIGLGEAFLTQIKLSLAAGFVLALPVILWQVWSFVVPALKPEERRTVAGIVFSSVLLFTAGVLFAYFAVFRFVVRFLITVAGPGLTPMFSVGHYISFLITFLLPFGLCFELPLIMYLLTRWGIVEEDWLVKNRRYAVVIVFIVAAALTPGPDVVSQLCMAGPLLVLYEVSVWVVRLAARQRRASEARSL